MKRRGRSQVARTAALLVLGAFAVHQLRYLLVYGSATGAELHREGHDYLGQALPILVGLAAAAIVARLVVGLLAAGARRAHLAPPEWHVRGLVYGLALVAVFWAQELTEGVLAANHPGGVAAVLGGGAWVAIPLALVLGVAAGALERLLDGAERAIALALGIETTPFTPARPSSAPITVSRAPLAARALAFGFARRPPPPVAVS